MSRHTEFNDTSILAVKWMAKAGLTDAQMAKELEIDPRTFARWKVAHPEFFEHLKDWKDEADELVEKSLYKRAIGYDYEAEKPMVVSTGDFQQEIQIAHYQEHIPGNVTAQIFWLKNRKSKEWRDKQEVGVTDSNGNDRSFTVSFADPDKAKKAEDSDD